MQLRFSKDLDILMALVSFLSMTEYKSMRPSKLAQRLGLKRNDVARILDEYKGIFRKSQEKNNQTNEYFYTVHLRYALRWRNNDNNDSDDIVQDNLPAEYLTTLLNFIANRAVHEENQKSYHFKNIITMIAAIIAAFASVLAVILSN